MINTFITALLLMIKCLIMHLLTDKQRKEHC